MEHEIKCEKCNKPMNQIGPFANLKKEGEPVTKWNGVFDFECVNEECENNGNIIKIEK